MNSEVFLHPHTLIMDLQTLVHGYSNMNMCLKSTSITFNLPSGNYLLVIAFKMQAKENFLAGYIFLFTFREISILRKVP